MSDADDSLVPMRYGVTVEDLTILGNNPLLGRLPPRELALVLEVMGQLAVTTGSELTREGEEGDSMYVVMEGTAVVSRANRVIRRIRVSDHFGELAMLGVRLRDETVVAETTMRLARLSRTHYQSLASRNPRAALHLLQALVGSLGDDLTHLTDSVAALISRRGSMRPLQIRVRTPTGEQVVASGTPADRLLPSMIDGSPVVAALIDAKPMNLDSPVVCDARVDVVTLRETSGRDAYRQSLGLLLLEAANTVAPDLNLRLSHAVDDLRVIEVRGDVDRAELCRRLERQMARLVEKDVLFHNEAWSVDEARAQLARQGWDDANLLLRTARASVTTLQTCGQIQSLVVGPMVPSARYLSSRSSGAEGSGFSLRPHPDGLLLDHGPAVRPDVPDDVHAVELTRELEHPRFGGEMVHAHRGWLASMGLGSIGDFNELCVRGEIDRVIRVAEGFHEKRIGQLADEIAARHRSLRVVAIAGPSSSGKTTFIKRLSVQLEVAGIQPINLSLDDYYVDRIRTPRDAAGEYDYEALEALDLALLREHLIRLVAGERVQTPRYDFKLGRSLLDAGPILQIGPDQVLLVEGIHGLADPLWPEGFDTSTRMRIFVHPATTLPVDRLTWTSSADLRLLRRLVRDRHGRAAPAASTIARWPSVRRGERLHIYPTFGNADAVFDTSLVYEIAVLKVYAERYLLEVKEDDPAFPIAYRLRQLIDPFVTIFPDKVPPTSILREFVGGSGFEY